MTTSISSLFHAGLFYEHNFVNNQNYSKHLTPKTTVSGFPKKWSSIFYLNYVIYQLSEIKDDI